MPRAQPAHNASAAKIACASDLSGLPHRLSAPESSSGQLILEEKGMLHW